MKLPNSSIAAIVLFTNCFLAVAAASAEPVNFPALEEMPMNRDFTVKVRMPMHDWQDVSVYLAKVDIVTVNGHDPQNSSVANFDFTGAVDVSITYNRGEIQSARIRPLSYGIKPKVKGSTISFSLSEPRNLSVEVNGDIFHNLHLFANAIETNRPSPNDPNVIYFAPGFHQLNGGVLRVPTGKTVYIAGGAVVRGQLLCSDVENVRICGRGILYESQGGVRIVNSTNVEVSGLVVMPGGNTVLVGQSRDVVIRDIKSISCGGNYDGIDIFCSSNVMIEDVFMRNSDDCIAIYGHRKTFYGDVKNITVRNSALWADVAHPIIIGTHGDAAKPETLEDLKFLDLDILDHSEAQMNYQGCMSVDVSDENLARNIRFENIRVEDFRKGQLVNLRVAFNRKYATAPGRGIENIYFKDITYNGSHADISVIAGYDETRKITNVVFENLMINGKVISDQMVKPYWFQVPDMAGFFVGEHVEGIEFRATAGASPTGASPSPVRKPGTTP